MSNEEEPPYEILPNGRPQLKPGHNTRNLKRPWLSRYTRLTRTWYKHHKQVRKRPNGHYKTVELGEIIEQDAALRRYFTVIKNRPRNDGYLSPITKKTALNSARHFLNYLQLPITNTAISELIQT